MGIKQRTVVLSLLAILALAVSDAHGASTGAANTQAVVVTMPFSGKWAWNSAKPQKPCGSYLCDSYPKYHDRYSADWATDLYAAPGTAVKFNLVGATTKLTYTASISNTSCSAGKRVRITVKMGTATLGWVQYDHLDTKGIDFSSIGNGKTLGITRNWGYGDCYQVHSDGGVHTHFSAGNTSKYSCWVDYGLVGEPLKPSAPIAIVGSNNTGLQQKCSPGASVSAYAKTIVQWSGDTKTQKTAWLVNSSAQREWIPTIPIYTCIAAGTRGPVQLPSKVLDLLTDTGRSAFCGSTPPVVTAVTGASGVVTTRYVWITVSYRDPECDVTGGIWNGATGSDLQWTFNSSLNRHLLRGVSCSNGAGSLQFARSCLWKGRWTEYMRVSDTYGNRSAMYPFTYTCT